MAAWAIPLTKKPTRFSLAEDTVDDRQALFASAQRFLEALDTIRLLTKPIAGYDRADSYASAVGLKSCGSSRASGT